ncbi:MAG TPA: response regulator [Ktedonobacterales bacterium]|jgi:CheY-like chemotaxis protein|nr:response regulator [Ktedonobacterales bacterium]
MAHVLVIDDDEAIRTAMRAALEEFGGHTVLEAPDGKSGLEILRASQKPLVVLLDLLMPVLDGLQVLRVVDADKDLAARHAYVLVTVSRRATSMQFAESLSMPVAFVSKPFDITEILDAVTEASQRISCGEFAG